MKLQRGNWIAFRDAGGKLVDGLYSRSANEPGCIHGTPGTVLVAVPRETRRGGLVGHAMYVVPLKNIVEVNNTRPNRAESGSAA